MIEFKNITLKVHRQTLLDDATLRISAGDKVVIRGVSGGGKSSLLKCAVGALPMDGGSVCVGDLALSTNTVADIRARIAFIGQEPVLGAENVHDALLLPFHFKAHCENQPNDERISQLLERLHLPASILGKPCKRISGGEKQRIAILRALLLNKTIFLADEVTSALDPESKIAVMAELFRPEITLLSVSHDPEWSAACGRVIEIANHKLIESVADPKIDPKRSADNFPVGNSANGAVHQKSALGAKRKDNFPQKNNDPREWFIKNPSTRGAL